MFVKYVFFVVDILNALNHANPNISKGIRRSSYSMKHLKWAICLFYAKTNRFVVFSIVLFLHFIGNVLNRRILFESSQTVCFIHFRTEINCAFWFNIFSYSSISGAHSYRTQVPIGYSIMSVDLYSQKSNSNNNFVVIFLWFYLFKQTFTLFW